VKLLQKRDLAARAFPFHSAEGSGVRLRTGGLWYMLEPCEARQLARELISAAAAAEAADTSQPVDEDSSDL
jgi:hypothetical protein